MTVLRNVLLGIFALSFFIFVAFFGRLPVFRHTPIGFLHRVVWIYIPNVFYRIDKTVSNGRISKSLSRFGNYVLNEKHPLVLTFFLTLVGGGAILFIPASWNLLPTWSKVVLPVSVAVPFFFTYMCNQSGPSSPHIVTEKNHTEQMMHYPYDHSLYHPGNVCRTCQLIKPARSKHCPLCQVCVARSDHHCVWVNNCLGRGNYKYFIGLLFSMSILLPLGTYLAYLTLKPQVQEHYVLYPEWHGTVYDGREDLLGKMLFFGERVLDALGTAFLIGGVSRGGIGLLTCLTTPLPAGLLGYHIYLIWSGMSTNESGKWSDWSEDINDGFVYMSQIRPDANLPPKGVSAEDTEIEYWKVVNACSSWSLRSKQFMVRTKDGNPPRHVHEDIVNMLVANEWRRCRSLKEVQNIYDLGFWGNIKELFFN